MKSATTVATVAFFGILFLTADRAGAQTPEQRRIDELERRVRDLESQVRELLAASPPKVSDTSDISPPQTSDTSDTSEVPDVADTLADTSAGGQQPVPSLGPPRAADETAAVSRTGP